MSYADGEIVSRHCYLRRSRLKNTTPYKQITSRKELVVGSWYWAYHTTYGRLWTIKPKAKPYKDKDNNWRVNVECREDPNYKTMSLADMEIEPYSFSGLYNSVNFTVLDP